MGDETSRGQLNALLSKWEEHREQGVELSAEELCADCPELTPELERRISALQKLNRLIASDSSPEPEVKWRGLPPLSASLEAVYDDLEIHGAGGFGVVFKANDGQLRREVAVKFIKNSRPNDTVIRLRFLFEAKITARLDHPGIVPVYGMASDEQGNPCYVMRFIRGESLQAAIERYHASEPDDESFRGLLRRFISVCNTVAFAHSRGVLHRDLTPRNVMIGDYQETFVVDWGLAKEFGSGESSGAVEPLDTQDARPPEKPSPDPLTRGMVGTPGFVSPEQARGEKLTPASDVYGLGAMLYVLLTGQSPFRGLSPGEFADRAKHRGFSRPPKFAASVPRPLQNICLKAMATRAEDRYPGALGLANDVDRWIADQPVSAYQENGSERLSRWTRRHRSWVQAGMAAMFLVTLVSAMSWGVVRTAWREESRALHQSRVSQARREIDLALNRFARGNVSDGILWLTRALNTAPPDALDLEHAIRANLANWSPLLPTLRHELNTKDDVDVLAYSPNGNTILTGEAGRFARLWNSETGASIGAPLEHDGGIQDVAFSPDGKRVVTGSRDSTAQVWDAQTGKPIGPRLNHENAGKGGVSVAFSTDGKQVLTGGDDRTAKLWDATTGAPIAVCKHNGNVTSVAFRPGGSHFATGSIDGVARLWDKTGTLVKECKHDPIDGEPGYVWDVAFSPDGKLLASAGDDHTVRLWDAVTGAPVGKPLVHNHGIWRVAFSPNSEKLATATFGSHAHVPLDFTARIWNVATQKLACPILEHDGGVWSLAFSPDGSMLLTGSDNKASLWDASTGSLRGEPSFHDKPVMAVAFHPNKYTQLFATGSKNLRLWDFQDLEPIRRFDNPASVDAVEYSFTHDGKRVLVGCRDGTATVWDVDDGRPILELRDLPGPVATVCLSRNGKIAVISYQPTRPKRGEAQIWNVETKKRLGSPLVHKGNIGGLAISSDESMILTGCDDGIAQLWDAKTGKLLGGPLSQQGKVNRVAFSPNGRVVFTGGSEHLSRLWDVKSGKPLGEPMKHGGDIRCVAFRPDGNRVATGSSDDVVRIWDVPTGQLIKELRGHEDRLYSIAYSPDGSRILSGDDNKTARLWIEATGEAVGAPMPHDDIVGDVAFSPEGKTLLTADDSGKAQFWDAETTLPIGPPLRHQGSVARVAFRSDGKTAVTTTVNSQIYKWRLRPPLDMERERIADWARMLTRREFTKGDTITELDMATWRKPQQNAPVKTP